MFRLRNRAMNNCARFISSAAFRVDEVTGKSYVDLLSLDPRVAKLPYSIRVLLESAVRNGNSRDIDLLLEADKAAADGKEIQFNPSRVILQDFTGVPAFVDLVAMRSTVPVAKRHLVNPVIPVDLIVDHSIIVDKAGTFDSLQKNEELEFERNRERFQFMKWASKNFTNTRIVPPGVGIVHQVNIELLSSVISHSPNTPGHPNGWLIPDTVIGTDSHTPMVNGLGVAGWGVGGIEALACMLGEPACITVPSVVRVQLKNKLREGVTATDLALHMTHMLRKINVVGQIVEYCGASVLSVEDRCTVANMAPEYGATMGYFPVDDVSLTYLRSTGRSDGQVDIVERLAKNIGIWENSACSTCKEDWLYSRSIEVDLEQVEPLLAGPKRPQDKVMLSSIKKDFAEGLTASPVDFKSYALPVSPSPALASPSSPLANGSVVLAAITSCTNTSNPALLITAGLIAKKASLRGFYPPAHVKPSLSPGSKAAAENLMRAGLMESMEALRFHVTGYGCMTCCGNSGDLVEGVANTVEEQGLVVAAVLSGNRNFEGRVHPLTRANYLASPPLVVAFALAGCVNVDMTCEPLGKDKDGVDVFLKDLWPSPAELRDTLRSACEGANVHETYLNAMQGSDLWKSLPVSSSSADGLFDFSPSSSYLQLPPFVEGAFDSSSFLSPTLGSVANCHALLVLGDSITTDHISPAGSIPKNSIAGKYLHEQKNVAASDLNAFGARRGHDAVMTRGTFANARLRNLALRNNSEKCVGSFAIHVPTNYVASPFEVANKYHADKTPLIIVGGKEYGSGSSRDWAAKGPRTLGVRFVVAESFERIHRSNLCGMGVTPLQISEVRDEDGHLLGSELKNLLDGDEFFDVLFGNDEIHVQGEADVVIKDKQGEKIKYIASCKVRIDTEKELQYIKSGNVMSFFLKANSLCEQPSQ